MTRLSSPAACLHPSNLLTYLSLMAAVAAVAAAMHGRAGAAGALLAASVLADTFDGRFARLFPRNEDRCLFGAHLDSLSDVAAFAVAPLVCLAAFSLPQNMVLEVMWWSAAFVYVACATTRLGFYNLSHASSDVFIGLPVPVAALIFSSALLTDPPAVLSIGLLLTGAVAMIAPVRIPRPSGPGLALFALWPVVLVVAHLALPR